MAIRPSDQNRMPTRAPKAFTLIEVLVVIAIIGIVLAILLPALQKVRQIASQTVCLSNMRHLSLAVLTYNATNDGKILPSARNSNLELRYPGNTDNSLGGPPWYELLRESNLLDYKTREKGDESTDHDADAGALHCPADKRDKGFASYSANRYVMGFSGPREGNQFDNWPMRKMSGLRGSLDNLILLGERGALEQADWSKVGGSWSMGGTSITTFAGYQKNDTVGFYLGRHGNPKMIKLGHDEKIIDAKVPFALADGHADVFRGQIDCEIIPNDSPGGLELDRAIVTDSPRGSWPKLSDKKKKNQDY